MLVTLIRAIILYIIVLVTMRLMGKREIGQLQPFEFAIAIMIADLASIPMSDTGIPIFDGIVPIFGLLIMQMLLSFINMRSITIRRIISGKPEILIYRGKIDEKALKKEKITLNELQERLRQDGTFSISDVEYAILETSGQLTVISKPEKKMVTPEDLGIMPEYEGIPYDLVLDGKVMSKNLQIIGKDYNWLKKEVQKFKMLPEEALIVTYDGKGQIFCQRKERKMKEIVIIVISLILVVTGSLFSLNLVEKTSNELIANIENLEENMTKELADEVYKMWQKIDDKWSIIVSHNDLDLIELSLIKAKSCIEKNDYIGSAEELQKSKFLIKNISEKQKFKLKNIF